MLSGSLVIGAAIVAVTVPVIVGEVTVEPGEDHRTSGRALLAAFAAVLACALLTLMILLASVIDVAWEQDGLERTVADNQNQDTLWILIALFVVIGGLMTALALAIAVTAAIDRGRRAVRWVNGPLAINLVLCVVVWWFGLSTAPTVR